MAAPSRQHVSIGDVLDQLRPEFSDITISKIRFLESQGLIDPERTPSGYRKFSPADVERLRFILREQREHFLPLKVIKERLDRPRSGAHPRALPHPPAARGGRSRAGHAARERPEAQESRRCRAVVRDGAARPPRSTKRASRRDVCYRRGRPRRPSVVADRSDAHPHRARQGGRHHRRRARPARGVRPRHPRPTLHATVCCSTKTRSPSHGSRRASCGTGSRRATSACTARSPSAKPACSSRCCLPYRRQRNPEAQARTHETLGRALGPRAATAHGAVAPSRSTLAHAADVTATVLLDADAVAAQVEAPRSGDRTGSSRRRGARRRAEGCADLRRRSGPCDRPAYPGRARLHVDLPVRSRLGPGQDPA